MLNHAEEVQQMQGRSHLRRYGSDVQHALFLAWHAANRISAKRLTPFLPTLIDALERHEHLQISEECRRQLLAMSAATADRLLASQRKLSQRGLSTTRAGTLLKKQIPIRTFQEWSEAKPGFLEADLVAHCGTTIARIVSLYPHLDRYHDRVDRTPSAPQSNSGCCHRGAQACPTPSPLSDLGDRYG